MGISPLEKLSTAPQTILGKDISILESSSYPLNDALPIFGSRHEIETSHGMPSAFSSPGGDAAGGEVVAEASQLSAEASAELLTSAEEICKAPVPNQGSSREMPEECPQLPSNLLSVEESRQLVRRELQKLREWYQ